MSNTTINLISRFISLICNTRQRPILSNIPLQTTLNKHLVASPDQNNNTREEKIIMQLTRTRTTIINNQHAIQHRLPTRTHRHLPQRRYPPPTTTTRNNTTTHNLPLQIPNCERYNLTISQQNPSLLGNHSCIILWFSPQISWQVQPHLPLPSQYYLLTR